MSANVVYLTRLTSQQFFKYSACTAVTMTGQVAPYGSVTGVAATNLISVPGLTAVNGTPLIFTNLAGGSNLAEGVKYYMVNASGSDFKVASTPNGTALALSTDITSASSILIQTDDLMVWSSEYRDIFTPIGLTLATPTLGGNTGASLITMTAALATDISLEPAVGSPASNGYVTGTPSTTNSDEVAHYPLRQTQLARSYWKFTMSTVPNTLYAEVMEGDVISDTAPNVP